MEFSTLTTASLHQTKTAALAVGVFTDGKLSAAADIIDQASNGALRTVLKAEFKASPGTLLTLRNLPGVTATRIILVGLGKQDSYKTSVHASAELAFAKYCANASLTEGVSALASIEYPNSDLLARCRVAAMAGIQSDYQYDLTLSDKDRKASSKLKKIAIWTTRTDAKQAQQGLDQGSSIARV